MTFMELEIINAKLNPLRDDEVRAIVEIEMHLAVKKWLMEYAFEDFDKEPRTIRSPSERYEVMIELRSWSPSWGKGPRLLDSLCHKGAGERVGSIGVSVHPNYWGRDVATKLVKKSIELARARDMKIPLSTALELDTT